MQGKGRRILLNGMSSMVILAMVMLGPTGSQAQTITTTTTTDTTTTTATATKKPKSVPEPSTGVLLLLGIGLTGLAGYSLKRLKHGE